jgi:hypothetical protein
MHCRLSSYLNGRPFNVRDLGEYHPRSRARIPPALHQDRGHGSFPSGGYLSRRDRTKVARYGVPGKAAIGEPSRRVRSDGYTALGSVGTIFRLTPQGQFTPIWSMVSSNPGPIGPSQRWQFLRDNSDIRIARGVFTQRRNELLRVLIPSFRPL